MVAKLIPFRWQDKRMPQEEAWQAAERVLAIPPGQRYENSKSLGLGDPELLLCISEILRRRIDTSPESVRNDAECFHTFLAVSKQQIGLFDERDYFQGEFALIAGGASRFLFRREEAQRWFARAESKFVLTANSAAHIARLAYQRLALRLEERQFEEVLELAPQWCEAFNRLGLPEDALKCRFLEGLSLRETGDLKPAIIVFQEINKTAEALGSVRLCAQATNNLAQLYRVVGNLKEALEYAKRALPFLQEMNDRIGLAKLRWCVGDICREQGKFGDAVDAYRAALRESEEIGIRGDVAAIHLVLADVLLDAGFDRQAEWEIRAALPIIEEEKMVPEGYAALALLQESLRRRKIDRQALRNLHGYFQDEKS
jgi:tetratricopeptide (TPR) repeat protein